MTEVWMLDYLYAVFPRWGVFESEEAAWAWVQTNDPDHKSFYTPFKLTVNTELESSVPTTCPENRYTNQR